MSENSMVSSSVCDSSATMKLNFNEMDKSELLQMLAFMQSELEAREIVIATLKSEKCKQLLYQAKYGRLNAALASPKMKSDLPNDNWCVTNSETIFSIYDPFASMQHDIQYVISGSDKNADGSVESNLKPVYDSQLSQLENLISSQKKAQMKMKDQIIYLEKKCVKLTQALEDERNKHERDAAQGDDVLVMLEKERERLKSELEYEKSHSRKLERELKRMMAVIEDQKAVIINQRLAASVIIKTKKQLESDLKAVNVIINKSVNVSDLITSDTSTKHNQESPENTSNNQAIHHHKNNSDRSHDPPERCKEKALKHNTSDITKHNKHPQCKEPDNSIPVSLSESVVTLNPQVATPIQKSRTGKQPESLLWKTYDPKNSLPNSGHNPSTSLTTKSPSNIRRQLPIVSMSNSIPVSSLSRQNENTYYKHSSAPSSSLMTTTTATAITPYQKILSTPPPNSIMNQAASFQNSLTSYGLFNICSPPLQSLSSHPTVAAVYKSTISSAKADIAANCSSQMTNAARSRIVASPIVVATSSAATSTMIRSGDSSPAIPKHVYANGK